MKSNWFLRQWNELKHGGHKHLGKDALLRIAADAISVNASLIGAFVVSYIFSVEVLHAARPEELAERFRHFVAGRILVWSSLALLIFTCMASTPGLADMRGAIRHLSCFAR